MGRPKLAPGTTGTLKLTRLPAGGWRARAGYRDHDGTSGEFARFAPTKTAAETKLREAIRDWQRTGGVGVRADMTVTELADEWLTRIDADHSLAIGTKQQYRRAVDANVKPALGKLRVGECRVTLVDRAVRTVRERHGYSVAKTMRSVLSGMFGLAVRQEAIASNPVRDIEKLTASGRKKPRALEAAQRTDLPALVRSSERAADLDLPDLVDFMLGTGCRIGEALACRTWANTDGEPLLDLDAGTWEINATVVRIAGVGLAVQEKPKSEKGWRVLALPPSVVAMLRRREDDDRLRVREVLVMDEHGNQRIEKRGGIVFSSPSARSLRDPNNTEGNLRHILDRLDCDECEQTGYVLDPADGRRWLLNEKGRKIRCAVGPWSWVTSHTFRKTVATMMEEAGCTPRQVADQLGHSKTSMTQDVYFGRGVVVADAARILNRG